MRTVVGGLRNTGARMGRQGDEGGQIVVIVALVLTAMSAALALVVDVGNARQTGVNLQSAADAGAVAGASQLASSVATAKTYAEEYAFDSLDQARGSTVTCPSDAPVPGTTVCYQTGSEPMVYVTTPYTQSPAAANGSNPSSANQINVKICATVSTTFARLMNVTSLRTCQSATADTTGSSTLPCAVCVLNPSAQDALWLAGGTATMNISGGSSVVVDSSNSQAVYLGPKGSAALNVSGGGGTKIVGGYALAGSGAITPNPTIGVGAVSDPLSTLQTPADLGLTTGLSSYSAVSLSSSQTQTITPGIYPSLSATNSAQLTTSPGNYIIQGNVTIGGNATLTLGAGVYVIEGGFTGSSGGTITGSGVTLYFTCSGYPTQTSDSSCPSGGGTGGYFSQTGGAGTTLSAPTSGTYKGLLMFYDRNDWGNFNPNTTSCGTYFVSNGSSTGLNATGTIYAASAQICLDGDATALNSLFVVNELYLSNGASITNNVIASQQVSLAAPVNTLTG